MAPHNVLPSSVLQGSLRIAVLRIFGLKPPLGAAVSEDLLAQIYNAFDPKRPLEPFKHQLTQVEEEP